MNIAFFGGTFDPIHRGHLAIAAAAAEKYELGRVLFTPNYVPPHREQPRTSYEHRFAMVALATQNDKRFVASDLESPGSSEDGERPSYSLWTIRKLKRQLRKADRLFYLIGVDAFLRIANWYEPVQLLRECEFIIASRPGFRLSDIAKALPDELRPPDVVLKAARAQKQMGDTLMLHGATLHILDSVAEKASATQIRAVAAKSGARLDSLVGGAVAEYIGKTGIYGAKASAGEAPRHSESTPTKSAAAHAKKRSTRSPKRKSSSKVLEFQSRNA